MENNTDDDKASSSSSEEEAVDGKFIILSSKINLFLAINLF